MQRVIKFIKGTGPTVCKIKFDCNVQYAQESNIELHFNFKEILPELKKNIVE